MPKISVIIPMYKVEKYLEECLNSIVTQTLKDIEIICVDDGSPDHSGDIAEGYAKRFSNIQVIRKENGGLSSARNSGLSVAQGRYVLFLDSDDYLLENALEELYEKAEKDALDVVYFNADAFFENEDIKQKNINYVNYYMRKGNYTGVYTGQSMFARMRKENEFLSSACLQLFRRALIEENGLRFYEGIIHEDNLFTFKCAMLAERTGYMKQAFYQRRVHDDSITTVKKTIKNVEGYLISYAEMLNFMHDRNIEEDASAVISEYLYNSIYRNAYNIYMKLDAAEKEKLFSRGDFCAFHFLDMVKRSSKVEMDLRNRIASLERSLRSLSGKGGKGARWLKVRRVKYLAKRLVINLREHGFVYTCKLAMQKIKGRMKRVRLFSKMRSLRIEKKIKRTRDHTPLVSIIMPVYNVEPYIEQGMDSLLNQSIRAFEIIAVDDGSTDRSLEILRRYEEADQRVHVFTQKNQYAGAARNLGLANAKGEYVIFLDSDDFFAPNLVKDAYYAAKMGNADVVLFGAEHYNQKTGEYARAPWLLKEQLSPRKQPFSYRECPDQLYQITTPCPWTKMFRREFVVAAGLQFQLLQNSNDVFFDYAALAMAQRIVTLNKSLVYYRVGLENNIQSTKKKNPLCFYEAYRAWHDKLVEIGALDTLRKSYVNAALGGCLHNLRTNSDLSVKKLVFDKLKNEILQVLELAGYEESFYYDKNNYIDLMLVKDCTFEEYLEKKSK